MCHMGDGDQYIHLKEIFVDFIKKRPTSVLELVFEDDYGVKHKSNEFKEGDLVNLDMYIRSHTYATLTIRRALFKISVAKIEVVFEPKVFGDDRAVGLEDSNHRVTVNFVCGRSVSSEDVTCVLGFRARNDLGPKVHRFLKLPQLAALAPALPPPTSEQGYDVLSVAMDKLNDDILLGIFNQYRLDEKYRWNYRLGWRNLSHVCRRWRHLIYESAFHLDMHIVCTHRTPVDTLLDHLPRLPLHVNYCSSLMEKDKLGIYHALRLHNRVRYIDLHDLTASILHNFLVRMDEHFPILEHLSLRCWVDELITPTLPKALLAPNLRHLVLTGIGLPKRLRLLTSTASLVTLVLYDIPASSYFRPGLLAARLSSLPRLQKLSIGFAVPIPRPGTDWELLGDHGTPKTLPNLKTVWFRGVSAYLESFVAQIRVPLLEQLDITLFHQIAFALPHLSHLINATKGLKLPAATVYFYPGSVCISTHPDSSSWVEPFCLSVTGKQLSWQIDCIGQICSSLVPALSDVEQLTLDFREKALRTEWENGEIDGTTWHELLRLFVGVKKLHVRREPLKELSRVLKLDDVGSDPGFLPHLEEIVAEDNLFASFIDTRQIVGRPVRFSKSYT